MVITIVVDMFGKPNNGTTVTAMREAKILQEMGNEVRIIGYIPEEHDDISMYKVYHCSHFVFPIFEPLIEKNGMFIADFKKEDYPKVREFIKGSDVVHMILPFRIEKRVRLIAKCMGIPVTSAFHCQPENISYNIDMGHWHGLNNFIYRLFYRWMYRYTRHIHTPSEMMKEQMELNHYKNEIHPISNGVSPQFVPIKTEKPANLKDKYVIMMVGRYSGEKRQDLIIKAIGHSKYNDKIQLILCGQGPKGNYLKKLSKKYLKNPCIFEFLSQSELLKVLNYCDLYIHASDAESEAIACIEAFCCGQVPIISDSPYSATNHFALDERCLFKAGDYNSLRNRIDYFIEHPEFKDSLSQKYIEFGKHFELYHCVRKLQKMFVTAIEDDKEDQANHRAFYSSHKERRQLRKAAKLAGIDNPVIYKDSVI
jgi:1,2-diacylglycerol 3-alpha-glucosyltransferase